LFLSTFAPVVVCVWSVACMSVYCTLRHGDGLCLLF